MLQDRVVKIDDTYFEVIIANEGDLKGFKLKQISAEKYLDMAAEMIIFKDVDISENNIMQNAIDAAQKTLSETLEANIKNTVLSTLGFEKDSWKDNGGWKIDHCNGRMSIVSDLISKKIKDRLLNIEWGKDFTLTSKEEKQIKGAAHKDYVEAYRYQITRNARHAGEKLASQHIDEFAKDLVTHKVKNMAELLIEQVLTPKKTK